MCPQVFYDDKVIGVIKWLTLGCAHIRGLFDYGFVCVLSGLVCVCVCFNALVCVVCVCDARVFV